MTLDQEIQLAFAGTQILVVFVTVLFDLVYRKVQNDKNIKMPTLQDKFKKLKGYLIRDLIYCITIVFINGFISFMFIPLFRQIIKESGNYFWTYSFTQQSFIFITIIIIGFFLLSLILTVNLIKHIETIQNNYNKYKERLDKKT